MCSSFFHWSCGSSNGNSNHLERWEENTEINLSALLVFFQMNLSWAQGFFSIMRWSSFIYSITGHQNTTVMTLLNIFVCFLNSVCYLLLSHVHFCCLLVLPLFCFSCLSYSLCYSCSVVHAISLLFLIFTFGLGIFLFYWYCMVLSCCLLFLCGAQWQLIEIQIHKSL